jgi:formate dehydrogenase assembly factor FdhD
MVNIVAGSQPQMDLVLVRGVTMTIRVEDPGKHLDKYVGKTKDADFALGFLISEFLLGGARQAEVVDYGSRHAGGCLADHDVARFEIAMHHTLFVQRSCSAASPEDICLAIGRAATVVSFPVRRRNCPSVSPSRNSIVK